MGGHGYMGWWGNMGGPKQKGITTYSLSPFEQKPFAGVARAMVFNTTRRVTAQIPYVGVAFAVGYGIYTWAQARHEFLLSKAGHAQAGEH
ncbi:Cytochrome b-c1 complex subunit 8 [Umbelopsis nana]